MLLPRLSGTTLKCVWWVIHSIMWSHQLSIGLKLGCDINNIWKYSCLWSLLSISFKEPFCPPRPSLPQAQEKVELSGYETDLQKLHEVRLIFQSLWFMVCWLSILGVPDDRPYLCLLWIHWVFWTQVFPGFRSDYLLSKFFLGLTL